MAPSPEIEGFSDLQFDIDAELGRTVMTLRALLDLAPHTTVKLPRPPGGSVTLIVGGIVACFGEIVVLNETIGIRIADFREEA